MRHNHLLSMSSSVQILYCIYVDILYLFKNMFHYSFCRKIIDQKHFPYIFNSPFRYFGFVPVFWFRFGKSRYRV